MENLIIQSIGFVGLLFFVLSVQIKQRKGILLFQVLGCLVYSVHFFLLGAITGAITDFIGAIRSYVFYNKEKKWASNIAWLYFFVALFIISALLTWKNIYSILPMLGMIAITVSQWMNNPKYIRRIMLLSPPCWFTYSLVTGSIPGMLTETIAFISIVVGIIRLDIMKRIK
jgi:hypothetical protein